jgi:2,3-bisphosphoglycerate-independent phosphoglycerate mutase
MDTHDLTRKLNTKNNSKIVMLVADGLGGLPHTIGGQTELEAANTPNLDALATRGGIPNWAGSTGSNRNRI